MSISEMFEDPGEFTIPLRADTPENLRKTIATRLKARNQDHIVITPQGGTSPSEFAEADLLAKARYAGPILEARFNEEPFELWGRGMVWHLDAPEGHGPIIADARQFTGAQLAAVIDDYADGGIIPATLTQGTVTNTGSTFDIGFNIGTPSLSAFRTTMRTFGAHFRVNPNGTVDAGPKTSNEVYTVNEADGAFLPVAMPKHWGSDPLRVSIEAYDTRATVSIKDMIDSAAILSENYDGSTSTAFSSARGVARYGIRNTASNRVKVFPRPASDIDDPTTFLAQQLDVWDVANDIMINLNQWELSQGTVEVGGFVWAWAPQWGIYDSDNEINHRGETIHPVLARIGEADVPLVEGMGVYWRPGASDTDTSDYEDLSPFVAWEQLV